LKYGDGKESMVSRADARKVLTIPRIAANSTEECGDFVEKVGVVLRFVEIYLDGTR